MEDNKIVTFKDLRVWQVSHELVLGVYEVFCKSDKRRSLNDQIFRSSVSVTSNIAEGFGRTSRKDKTHFYVMARGSLYELQDQLQIAKDVGLISMDDYNRLEELAINSLKLLHKFIAATDRQI